MDITKEWLEQQRAALADQIKQLERDVYAKDGAIQALDSVIAKLSETNEG